MCEVCKARWAGRRGFLGVSAGLLTGLMAGPATVWAAGEPTTSLSADQALAKLRSGNARYVSAPDVCMRELASSRQHVAKHQAPWATILSCADSRVPPELLFGGTGLGELFVARNAGSMADTATMGTIEYGAAVLGVPLIVVLGHERCGAVAAACQVVERSATFPGSIGPMVGAIVPAAQATKGKPGDFVENAMRENARMTAHKIATQSAIVADLVKRGKVKVVAARYDLDTGEFEIL